MQLGKLKYLDAIKLLHMPLTDKLYPTRSLQVAEIEAVRCYKYSGILTDKNLSVKDRQIGF